MGLIYEYSRPGTPAQAPPEPPSPPAAPAAAATPADAMLTGLEQQSSDQQKAEKAAATPTGLRGLDVFVAGIFMMMTFCVGITFSSILFAPPLPEATVTDAESFQFNMETIMSAYEHALIALYAYAAVHFALGLVFAVGFVLTRLNNRFHLLGIRRMEQPHVYYAIGMGLLGGLGIRGGTLLAAGIAGDLPTLRTSLLTLLENTTNPVILVALFLWLMVLPLTQELFFRGVIYTWLRQHRSLVGSLFLSALINALLNLYLLDFISSIMVAVGLAYVYERTGSVFASYLAHSSFNFMALALYFLVFSYGG